MILARVPLRIGVIGGGSDIQSHFNQVGNIGSVLNFTIDKYCYVTLLENILPFKNKFRISYAKTEEVNDSNLIENDIIREILKLYDFKRSIHLSTFSDVPGSSGLGSSSSFCAALIQLLEYYNGRKLSPLELAKMAYDVEREKCCFAGGWQDQLAASFGGVNLFKFDDNDIQTFPISLSSNIFNEVNENLCIIFSGIFRSSADQTLSKTHKGKKNYSEILNKGAQDAIELANSLNNSKSSQDVIDLISNCFNQSMEAKIKFEQNLELHDTLVSQYKLIMDSGSKGAKLCGAGGGGFFVAVADQETQKRLQNHFQSVVPIKIVDQGVSIWEL